MISGVYEFVRVCMCLSVCLFVCVSTLKKENGLSYQHETWYTYTPWQSLGVHWPWSYKVKGQGHTVTKTVTVARLPVAAMAVVQLLRVWDCTSYDCLGFWFNFVNTSTDPIWPTRNWKNQTQSDPTQCNPNHVWIDSQRPSRHKTGRFGDALSSFQTISWLVLRNQSWCNKLHKPPHWIK